MNTTSQPSDDATRSCAPVAGSALRRYASAAAAKIVHHPRWPRRADDAHALALDIIVQEMGGDDLAPAVEDYLRKQMHLYRYWCVAGPGGSGWRYEDAIQNRANYSAIRDHLERLCGETAESDPYIEHRQQQQNTKGS